jgi:hypothetical protein
VKKIAPRELSVEDVGRIAGDVVRWKIELSAAEATRRRAEDDARRIYESTATGLKGNIAASEKLVHAWAMSRPRPNGEPLVWAFARAVVRRITGQPSVKLLPKVKVGDVVAALKRYAWGAAYLRPREPDLDREAILADRDQIDERKLELIGVKIVQDEDVRIEEPKPATTAAEEAA